MNIVHTCLIDSEDGCGEVKHHCSENDAVSSQVIFPAFKPDSSNGNITAVHLDKDRKTIKRELDAKANNNSDKGIF